MAFGDITHGSADGSAVTGPANPDDGPYYVEGKAGAREGPFARWVEAQKVRDQMQAEWLWEQALYASQKGQGR